MRQRKLTEEDLVRILREEISNSENNLNEIENSRARALDYYYGSGVAIEEEPGAICEGRSKIVSTDVASTVDACMAEILPCFNQMAAEFQGNTEEDQGQADEESKIVDYYFFDKSKGHSVLHDALFDSLTQKNSYLKPYWHEEKSVSTREFENLNVMELQQRVMEIMQDDTQEITDFDEKDEGFTLEVRT